MIEWMKQNWKWLITTALTIVTIIPAWVCGFGDILQHNVYATLATILVSFFAGLAVAFIIEKCLERNRARKLFMTVDAADIPIILDIYKSSGYVNARGYGNLPNRLEKQGVITVDDDGRMSMTTEWKIAIHDYRRVIGKIHRDMKKR